MHTEHLLKRYFMIAFDLGCIDYSTAFALQEKAQAMVLEGEDDIVFFLEHPPTVSIGKNFGAENVPAHLENLWNGPVDIVHSTRGGNVTCHFPGQLVVYPIINLKKRRGGLRGYVHDLEETAIRTLRRFGIAAERREGFPGVWIKEKKIASLGLAVLHHVTMHGMSLNIDSDLSLFKVISPCGLGVSATSAALETNGKAPDMKTAKQIFLEEFFRIFSGSETLPCPELLTREDFTDLSQNKRTKQ